MKENKASSTAYIVVYGMVHTIKKSKLAHLLDKETIQACSKILSITSLDQKRLEELNDSIKSKVLPFGDLLLIPSDTLNYTLRKKYIEEKIFESLFNHLNRIINAIVDFTDPDSAAILESQKLIFIERSHSIVIGQKTKVLNNPNFISELYFNSINFTKEYDSTRQKSYNSEDALVYFDGIDVKKVFDSLCTFIRTNDIIIFSSGKYHKCYKNNIELSSHNYLKLKNKNYFYHFFNRKSFVFVKEHEYKFVEMANNKTYRQKNLTTNFKSTLDKREYISEGKVA